jgi:tetratricopeptide (TPR) repeat protein
MWYCTLAHTVQPTSDASATEAAWRRCAEASTASRDTASAAMAWAELAALVANHGDVRAADALVTAADSAAKLGGEPIAFVYVDQARCRVALERGDFAGALAAGQRAVDAARALAGAESKLARSYAVLSDAQLAANRFADARASLATAYELYVALSGPDHPTALESLHHLAVATESAGDLAAAAPLWERAAAGTARVFGADSLPMMRLLVDRANVGTPGGARSSPEALAAIERAVAIGERMLPAKDPERAQLYETLALVQEALHDRAAALATYRRAIAFYETLDDPLGLARVLYDYADALKEAGNCADALPQFRRAAKVASLSAQRTKMEGVSRGAIGSCLGTAGRLDEAERELRASIAILDEAGDAVFASQYRWELAGVLLHRGHRADALALAHQAADVLRGRPPPAELLAKQIDDWIAQPK